MKRNLLRMIATVLMLVTMGSSAYADDTPPTLRNKLIDVISTDDTSVTLQWDNAVDDETPFYQIQYQVIYSEYKVGYTGSDYVWKTFDNSSTIYNTICKVTGLEKGKTYVFEVRAWDKANNSTEYNTIFVKVGANDQPAKVVNPTVAVSSRYNSTTKQSTASINLSPVKDKESTERNLSYAVSIIGSGSEYYTETLTDGATGVIFRNLTPGQKYVGQVIAYDESLNFTPWGLGLTHFEFIAQSYDDRITPPDPVVVNKEVRVDYVTDKRIHISWDPAVVFGRTASAGYKVMYSVYMRKKGDSEWIQMPMWRYTYSELEVADNEANTEFEIKVTAAYNQVEHDYDIINVKTKSMQNNYWPHFTEQNPLKAELVNGVIEVKWSPAVSVRTPSDDIMYRLKVIRTNKDGSTISYELGKFRRQYSTTYSEPLVANSKYKFVLFAYEDEKYYDWDDIWNLDGYLATPSNEIEIKGGTAAVRLDHINRFNAFLSWDPMPNVPESELAKVKYQVYVKKTNGPEWQSYLYPINDLESWVHVVNVGLIDHTSDEWIPTNIDFRVDATYNGNTVTLGVVTGKTWGDDTDSPTWGKDPLKIVSVSKTSATVKFDYARDNCDHPWCLKYYIYLYENGKEIRKELVNQQSIGTMPRFTPVYTFTGLMPNTNYEFALKAVDQSYNSGWTSRKAFSTTADVPTDINGDGKTDINDITTLVEIILGKKK